MQILKWEKSGEKFSDLEPGRRLTICFGVILFIVLTFVFVHATYTGFLNYIFINTNYYYISEYGYVAPLIFFVPFPLLLTVAGVQKLLNYKNEKTFLLAVKVMFVAIPVYFAFSIICSLYIESNLKNHGYTYCSWYEFSPTRSPDVWLKNSELCLKVHHNIVSDIEEWFKWHNEQGIEPQLDELKAFIAKKNKEQGR